MFCNEPTAAEYASAAAYDALDKNRKLQDRVELLEKQVAALYRFIDSKYDMVWREPEIWRDM